MHLLRLAHHNAEVGGEGLDRAGTTHGVPGCGGDRVLDQFDERLKVGSTAAAAAATHIRRTEWDRGNGPGDRAAAPLDLGQHAGIDVGPARRLAHAIDAGGRRTGLHGKGIEFFDAGVAVAEGPSDAQSIGREIGDGDDQIGHLIGDAEYLSPHQTWAGDLQHLVFDAVVEMQRFQQQFEGALERNFLVERNGDGGVAPHRFALQPNHIEIEGNIGLLGEGVEHGSQRLVVVRGLYLRGELPVNSCLGRRDPRLPLRVQARAILREVFPVLCLGKLDWPDERLAGALDVLNHIEETALLLPFDRFLRVESADHPALGQQLPDHSIVGGELAGLLGDGLCFGIPPFIDECVVILNQHRQTLVYLHPLGAFAIDLRLHLGVALIEGHFGPALAGGFFNVPPGAIDSFRQLGPRLRRNIAGVHLGLGGVEQGHGIERRTLGGAFGFQLLGGDFSRQLGHHEILRQRGFFVSGSPLGRLFCGSRHRRRRLPRPGHRFFDRPSGV